jgi:hypothetical protein
MLQVSENNIAEMLYRQVAVAARVSRVRSRAAGSPHAHTLTELGLDTTGLRLKDGSGLSPRRPPHPKTAHWSCWVEALQTPKFIRSSRPSSRPCLSVGAAEPCPPAPAGSPQWPSQAARPAGSSPRPERCSTPSDCPGTSTVADGELKVFSALVNDRPSVATARCRPGRPSTASSRRSTAAGARTK